MESFPKMKGGGKESTGADSWLPSAGKINLSGKWVLFVREQDNNWTDPSKSNTYERMWSYRNSGQKIKKKKKIEK